jgi:polyisoprenoid-binding protein YceI
MRSIVKTLLGAGAIAGFALASIGAQSALPTNLRLSKESRIWIDGTSTVKSFTCAATKIDVSVASEPGSAPADLVQSASIVIPVAQLDCKNGTMNEHMRKALKAKENPTISWRMTSYRVDGTSVVMNGRLMIAGKENVIELRATGVADNDGTIRMKGATKFKMSEYGVKPPTLMLGTMKVGDPITVSFDLVLSPS